MRPADNIEKSIKKLRYKASAETRNRILGNVMQALENKEKQKPAAVQPDIWRIIMKSPITKLAAAAVIIIAVLLGMHQFGSPIESVALADVLDRIEHVQVFMYRIKMTMTGNMMPNMPSGEQLMQATVIISDEFGTKMESQMTNPTTGEKWTQQVYIIPDQKIILTVMPQEKKYTRMEFDDDLLAKTRKKSNDPREMIKQIMSREYTELGRSVIDGIEVEGFQTTDNKIMAGMAEDVNMILWVDVESWLPVSTEMDIKMNEQMQMHCDIYDYQWDILIDASEFEPVIPEDYTASPIDGMKLPSMNEESAIEGLKLFAELAGRYPENLNMMTLVHEIDKLKDSQTPAAEQFQKELEQLQTEDEISAKTIETMRPIQSLGGFYITLVRDKKDPAYYGDSVGPDDTDVVLMRWKESEDNYRVIFGDLTTSDVTAEELAELESLLEQ